MKYAAQTIEAFSAALASKAPTPGGGGAAAVMGALGVSLGAMVGSLTLGKKKYRDVEEEIQALMEQAEALRMRLLSFADADEEAFLPLAAAYSIPKEDPSRKEVMEAALKTASETPLALMHACCEGLTMVSEFAKKGSALAVSDAGCGAACLKAALQSASFNVYINIDAMEDKDAAEAFRREADELLLEYEKKADEIVALVKERIGA